ncbi:asparagine synthase (glutamine-hydrolyzing) [Marinimicrobium alkaliphilum]|uniref:asparagine synthase (glutamine-hydrolyzing) n=1 Tax=Marinimicrobium alkaliphilum TaxID=2202654 RepID=UPI000DBAC6A8|nr:asparagine synthase (glutamine-hydrolyzing) [Marinimicrobium alkaliphilum]
MCGISGLALFNKASSMELRSYLDPMVENQNHRGPDASGIHINDQKTLALGHNRLSIIDLSFSANQPMSSECGNFTIVFNGEIYNHKELATILERQGIIFRTHSDTEVLLYCLICLGVDETIRNLKGMYAFAFYDSKEDVLTLARDYIGEKPLHYCINERGLAFSSELKALFASGFLKTKEINKESLAQYFRYGYIPSPNTIINQCYKLHPGHSLTYFSRDKKITTKDHRRETLTSEKNKCPNVEDYPSAKSALKHRLNSIIERQSISDVPLGAFLSGGIDSTLVTSVLQSQSESPVDTFTIGFTNKAFDESSYAKDISNYLGTNHNEVILDGNDLVEMLDTYCDVFDEPFADASALPSLAINKHARKSVKVCLSGDGGDELFCGYNRYSHTFQAHTRMSKLPSWAARTIELAHGSLSSEKVDHFYHVLMRILRRPTSSNIGLKLQKLVAAKNYKSASEYYTYLCSYWTNLEDLIGVSDDTGVVPFISNENEVDFIKSAMSWDMENYLPGDNLVKTDRTSMHNNLEIRVPLLDIDMLALSNSMPLDHKYYKSQKKFILKDTLTDYVPSKYIDRPKMGFTPPIGDWLNSCLNEQLREYLSSERIRKGGILSEPAIFQTITEHQTGFRDHSNKLWAALIFQRWHERHYEHIKIS